MDAVNSSMKRKKRKTRKCLDDLRNRSRRNISDNSFEHSSQPFTKVCNTERKANNGLITTDRLTLQSIFSKAIRSETITRPVAEIKQNKTVVDFVRDKVTNDYIQPVNEEKVCCTISTNFDRTVCTSDFEESPKFKQNNCNTPNHAEKLSNSFTLFSPTNKSLAGSKTPNEDVATSLTSSSQTPQGDHGTHLYDEFMSEISLHFRELTSSIITNDAIKNTISSLKKLYTESCQKEYEDNILKCINGRAINASNKFCNPNEIIVENPLDYIRLEHKRQQNALTIHQLGPALMDGSSSSSVQSPDTPVYVPNRATSAKKVDVILYDTPEYNYYPHRLN